MSITRTRTRVVAIDVALEALQAGRPVIALDDVDGTGIGMMILAGTASVHSVAEMIRDGSGFICVTVTEPYAHRLCLPPMTWEAGTTFGGRMCVAVDAAEGVTTGISAHDRAVTLRTLADRRATPASFTRPGHVVPVLATDADRPDRARLIAQAGHLCARRAGDPQGWPVAFTSLVSRRDPRRDADTSEVGHWDLPVIRHSDLWASITDTHRDVA
ncbi:3,4-dihydroxy-2-butanone-4-phosphate synthase [Rhodococcus sp. B50]|uniref:3,4-dihydroxy-2-butanone-4-phosphate synthase n=1 Tax=Rhodococcus sp. B50 TaxID=2682847 RepID=UPI0019DF46CC|nr:3,4-dihydroxy-2-butanone-4-phosphate synthase [Rhodococcus sp. B50]MBS9375202.1 3,4-dihydroxy-2-butanone 4-phosphate synthase [Rhodococcus sp. B50]